MTKQDVSFVRAARLLVGLCFAAPALVWGWHQIPPPPTEEQQIAALHGATVSMIAASQMACAIVVVMEVCRQDSACVAKRAPACRISETDLR